MTPPSLVDPARPCHSAEIQSPDLADGGRIDPLFAMSFADSRLTEDGTGNATGLRDPAPQLDARGLAWRRAGGVALCRARRKAWTI